MDTDCPLCGAIVRGRELGSNTYRDPTQADAEVLAASQAVVDFDWSIWERGDIGTVVMRKSDAALMLALLDRLRAALADPPELPQRVYRLGGTSGTNPPPPPPPDRG